MLNEVNGAILLVVIEVVVVELDVGNEKGLTLADDLSSLHLLQEHASVKFNESR